jgi:hypothetical protein
MLDKVQLRFCTSRRWLMSQGTILCQKQCMKIALNLELVPWFRFVLLSHLFLLGKVWSQKLLTHQDIAKFAWIRFAPLFPLLLGRVL